MLLVAWFLPSRVLSTSKATTSGSTAVSTKCGPHDPAPRSSIDGGDLRNSSNSSSNSSSSSSSSSSSRSWRTKLCRVLLDIDVLGAGLFTAATAVFLVVVNEGGQKRAWRDPVTLGLGFAFLALVAAFLLAEAFVARRPLIPLRLLRMNGVGVFCALQVLLFGARLAVSFCSLYRSELGED
jgi:hypothetical protein